MAMAFKMATTGMWVTEECKNSFMEMKWKKVHRYIVFKIDEGSKLVTVDKSKIFFIAWAPTASRIRAKMLYATSKDGLRRALDGIHYEVQATDPTEMGFDVIKDRAK
ncbi:Actin-depolymerizing factor 5 [Abeliophyllum distichum]|uniref:Actin-depolymerizing factor 5 n=1 Tax=Abeliophyllum distichum TaxID=126358 RepID=A0ABD1P801_9LAMI